MVAIFLARGRTSSFSSHLDSSSALYSLSLPPSHPHHDLSRCLTTSSTSTTSSRSVSFPISSLVAFTSAHGPFLLCLGFRRSLAHLPHAMLGPSQERPRRHQGCVPLTARLINAFQMRSQLFSRPPLQDRRHVHLQDGQARSRQGSLGRHRCTFLHFSFLTTQGIHQTRQIFTGKKLVRPPPRSLIRCRSHPISASTGGYLPLYPQHGRPQRLP